MKIKNVETFHVLWQAGKSAWVRLTTDEGLYGIGEASPMADGNASLEMIHSAFTPYLIGQNPLDHRLIQDQIMHAHIKLGPDGAFAAALAAVDIALWDLKGKILCLPVYQLLGGAWRKELPFYASIGGNASRSPQEVCRVVEEWLELKPALIKIRLDGDKTRRDADLRGDIARAEAVRRLVGDQFPLAFDANNAYSIQGAIWVGQALQGLGFEWFEEPVQHYHMHSFEQVSRALEIAIAAGEQEYTLQGIQRLIEAGVRIVQPDIVKTGGFTGLMDMAALARLYGVDFVPHQTQPSIGHRASMHLVASLTHAHYPVEFSDKSGRQEIVFRSPDLKPHNGKFVLPDLPGLGLELDEPELEERIHFWK